MIWQHRFDSRAGAMSGAVSGAERSGPPCCGVVGWAHPAEPRVRSVPPGVEHGAGVRKRTEQGFVGRRAERRSRRIEWSTFELGRWIFLALGGAPLAHFCVHRAAHRAG
jgi:hypothetical protein